VIVPFEVPAQNNFLFAVLFCILVHSVDTKKQKQRLN